MKKSDRGFTIIELMIVIAVIAILGLGAVPAIRGMVNKGGSQYAADELYSAIMLARMRAVRNNQWTNITFNVPGVDQYTIQWSGEVVNLAKHRSNPTFIRSPRALDPAPIPMITFSPQGFATVSGNVYLNDEFNQIYRIETTYPGITTVKRWAQGSSTWR